MRILALSLFLYGCPSNKLPCVTKTVALEVDCHTLLQPTCLTCDSHRSEVRCAVTLDNGKVIHGGHVVKNQVIWLDKNGSHECKY